MSLLVVSSLQADEFDEYLSMSLDDLLNVEVTTTSKYVENLKDSPANMYVISREQILKRGYRNIGDILKSLPGVDIQNYSLLNSPTTVTMRGHAGNNKFLLLQDGVRLSSAGGEAINMSFNFPVYYAKQVEILMGPSSVSYGADAFMGVINIITMEEELVETQISTGEDGYKQGYFHFSKKMDNGVHLSLGGQGYQSNEFEFAEDFPEYYPAGDVSPTGNPFDFSQTKENSFFAKIKIKNHWDFGFNFSQMEASNYYAPRSDVDAFDTSSIGETTIANLYGSFQADITDKLHSTSLLTLMSFELGNGTNFNNLFTDFVPLYKYELTERISFNQDFIYNLNEDHKISFGAVYDDINTIPVGADLPTPYNTSLSVNQQNFNYPGTTLPLVLFENNHENVGVYLQDNWIINDQWRLVTGIRYDNDSFHGSSTNPRVSAIYKPNDKNLVKLLYGQAYLAPSSENAFINFGDFSGFNSTTGLWESFFFQAPNPELQPEELQTLEFTYEHWFEHNTHIKFAPYYTRIDSVVRLSADPVPQQFIPGAEIGFTNSNKNSGELDIYGADLSLENISSFNSLHIESWLNISFVNGRLEENSVKTNLPLISEYKIKGGASFIYRNKYTLTPQIYWVDDSNNNQADPAEPTKRLQTDSYFVTDLHAEVVLTKNLNIVSDIYNLFDKKHSHATHFTTFTTLPEAPQPGRLITVGLYYKF
ncbi:MAG: hypothetical protein DIZ80_01000 [endosymbiont of Galathealinum brachiosum]|uniref:TonB-dependent receptor n=1 Tax=endosymbiont of Galathealinum brachiosum TaxID=2200906 RepID=A0A370DP49_9GAMM|nr:MAG: hypothetical protein DIZ80_01000 [endosymbiont of Galathealinum brachiosum]